MSHGSQALFGGLDGSQASCRAKQGPISEVVTSAESLVGLTETFDRIEIGIKRIRRLGSG